MRRVVLIQLKFVERVMAIRSSKYSSIAFDSPVNASVCIRPDGWDKAKPYTSIPGPKGLPIIGNNWRFFPVLGDLHGQDFFGLSKLLYKKYGNIARLGETLVPDIVMVYSPQDIEYLFRNEGHYPIRESTIKTLGYYRKNIRSDIFKGATGVSEVQGKDWYDVRSKANPILMRPKTVLQYVGVMDTIAHQLVEKMRFSANLDPQSEMPENFTDYIYAWALESVFSATFDKQLGCLNPNLPEDSEPTKIIRSILEVFDLYFKLEFGHFIRNMYKTRTWRRFVELLDYLNFTFGNYIEEALNKPDKTNGKPSQEATILQQLIKHGKATTLAVGIDILLGGVDTTGKIMGSGLYYLAKTPKAQNALREELCRLLPNKNTPITEEILSQAPYLKAVVKEITRLAPISVGNIRQTSKDLVMSGYQIPKGTTVMTANFLLSLSKEHYAKPNEFIPDRWLRNNTGELSVKNVNPFVTLPFGFGPRSCLGKRLATQELEVGIAKIIRNFCLEWHYKDMTFKGTPFYGVVDPLKLRVIEVAN